MGKYLVTGGAGFIGRHLCEDLLEAGHEVRVLDSLVEQVHGGTKAHPALQEAEFFEGDMRDADAVRRAVEGVEGVFHLAAEVGVGQSMYEIERYVGANDLGTAILLQALIQHPVARVVVASSMSVYGEGIYADGQGRRVDWVRRNGQDVKTGRWDPLGEDGQPLHPEATDETKRVDLASIYALTKYTQEQAVLIFGSAYEPEAVALRLFNVFGPGQALSNPYTGVLANFGSRLMNGQRPLVFEDGEQRRDFVHVRDVARAFRLAMERPRAAGHVINIGSGRSYTIASVASRLADAMGREAVEPEILQRARAGDIRHCFADIGKARELLGFVPERFLETDLPELAEWIAGSTALDRGLEAKSELEARGLVA